MVQSLDFAGPSRRTVGVTGGGIAFGLAGFRGVLALVGLSALLIAGLSLAIREHTLSG